MSGECPPVRIVDEDGEVLSEIPVGGADALTLNADGTLSIERSDGLVEPTHVVPNNGEPWSTADVLGEMMAGMYRHGECIEIHGCRLYESSFGETGRNVWTVHPPEDAESTAAVDALNLDNFATGTEIENCILSLAEGEEGVG